MSLFKECLSKTSYINQLMSGFFNMLEVMNENYELDEGLSHELFHNLWDNYYERESNDITIDNALNRLVDKFIDVYIESDDMSISYELLEELWIRVNIVDYRPKMSLVNACLLEHEDFNKLLDGFFDTLFYMDKYSMCYNGLCEKDLYILWVKHCDRESYDGTIDHIINRIIDKFIYAYVDVFESNDMSVSHELLEELWMYTLHN